MMTSSFSSPPPVSSGAKTESRVPAEPNYGINTSSVGFSRVVRLGEKSGPTLTLPGSFNASFSLAGFFTKLHTAD